MAWVRPKHPKRKQVDVDPTEALRPVLEYFSCSRPSASNSNNKQLMRVPKKPLVLDDSYERRLQKRHYEEPEHHQRPEHHHQRPDHHHQRAEHHQRTEHHRRLNHHQEADHYAVDDDRADYDGRASQRTTSRYTRDVSPPPPLLPSYRSNARPGAHLRLMPSRHHVVADAYTSRRPASRWSSATTPLEM